MDIKRAHHSGSLAAGRNPAHFAAWVVAFAVSGLLAEPSARSQPSPEARTPAERRLEWTLLHLKLDLKGLPRWSREHKKWQPYTPARGGLTVVNLWSRACKPCLSELPLLAEMAKEWQQAHPEVHFVFAADPPDQTTPGDVMALWKDSAIELPPGQRCPGDLTPGSPPRCLIKLPDSDPVRPETSLIGSVAEGQLRPVTLLVDGSGIVRHAFVGAIDNRRTAVNEAIDRLLGALKR